MSETHAFARVSMSAIRALGREDLANFDIFLPRADHERPVLYCRSSDGISDTEFDRMERRGIKSLFVLNEDFAECSRNLESRLDEILDNPQLLPSDKAEIVQTAGRSIAKDLIRESASTNDMERVALLVENLVMCVLTDPLVSEHLLRVAAQDRSAANHAFAVSALTVLLGCEVFGPNPQTLYELGLAGFLHDLGKLSIPPAILNKETPLTREELAIVHQHPIESARLIGDDPKVSSVVRQMIVQHHERVDGRGYPLGVSGEDLLPGSRLLSIVDSFHAMIGHRPFRAPLLPTEANRVLATQAGKQFDPEMLACWHDVFRRHWSEESNAGLLSAMTEPDECSTRHEHRPAPPAPRMLDQRPKRFACNGNISLKCNYAGRLIDITAAPDEFYALVHDVSKTGACVYSKHPMYRGEVLDVCLNLDGEEVWLRSTVAWTRHRRGEDYQIGLRFVQRLSEPGEPRPASVATLEELASAAKNPSRTLTGDAKANDRRPPRRPIRDKQDAAFRALAGISAMRRPNTQAQKMAVELATSSDAKVRLKAVDVLIQLGTGLTCEALLHALDDANPQVRKRAIEGVGTVGMTQAKDALVAALADSDEVIALQAAITLGKLGHKGGLGLVKRILTRSRGSNLSLAVQAFAEITGKRVDGIKAARQQLATMPRTADA